jgi:quercetin dioxygenase-like cupin family protein
VGDLDHVYEIAPQRVWEGVIARVVQGDQLTMAVVELEPNAVVPEHRHPNEQTGLVIEGSITFTVADETRELGPGGTWRILGDTPHAAVAGPDGATVIDVFAPIRSDWVEIPPQEPGRARWPGD